MGTSSPSKRNSSPSRKNIQVLLDEARDDLIQKTREIRVVHVKESNLFFVIYVLTEGSTLFGGPPLENVCDDDIVDAHHGEGADMVNVYNELKHFYRIHNGFGMIMSVKKHLPIIVKNFFEGCGFSGYYIYPFYYYFRHLGWWEKGCRDYEALRIKQKKETGKPRGGIFNFFLCGGSALHSI